MRKLPRQEVKNLLNLVAQGDDTATSRLYSVYQPGLYAYVRYRLWDDGGAEEVVIDTLFTAFRKADSYDGLAEFSTWLCGIANNMIREWRRRNAKYQREIGTDDPEFLDTVLEPAWDVLAKFEEREAGEALIECIDRLPDTQRESIYWTAVENCSLEDTAVKTGTPVGTVKSRLFHARRAIRACLERAMGAAYVGEKIG